VSDNGDPEFWVFRRPDGHVITSGRTDYYESGEEIEKEAWDDYAKKIEGEWTAETRTQFDANTVMCLVGKCEHGRIDTSVSPLPADWAESLARVTRSFEELTKAWEGAFARVAPVFDVLKRTMHDTRISFPDHARMCSNTHGGSLCFCSCRACVTTDGGCGCAHCGCES
jgi:hypothetical protein